MIKTIADLFRDLVEPVLKPHDSPISFSQPTLDDSAYRVYYQTTWVIMLIATCMVAVISLVFIQSGSWRQLATTMITASTLLIALPFQLFGNSRWAIYILICGTFIATWDGIYTAGGLNSIGIQAIYPIFVVVTILTYSHIFRLFTVLTLVAFVALAYLHSTDRILTQDAMVDKPIAGAVVIGGMFLITVVMLRYVALRTSFLNRELMLAQADAFEAKQEADRANQLKSIFLANMSHELRTPLNAIIGYGEGLIEDQDFLFDTRAGLNGEAVEDVNRIVTSGRHLLNLINEIIDLSKIEAERVDLKLSEISLDAMVEHVTQTVKPLAIKNRNMVSTQLETGLTVCSDQLKLTQIVINLVTNAVKYTHGGTVQITLRKGLGPYKAEIIVVDNGTGIRKEQLDDIFEPFQRAETLLGRPVVGSGLGLAICKRLTTFLGCDLGVESEFGVGSTFWLKIPATVPDGSAQIALYDAVDLIEEKKVSLN